MRFIEAELAKTKAQRTNVQKELDAIAETEDKKAQYEEIAKALDKAIKDMTADVDREKKRLAKEETEAAKQRLKEQEEAEALAELEAEQAGE